MMEFEATMIISTKSSLNLYDSYYYTNEARYYTHHLFHGQDKYYKILKYSFVLIIH